MGWARRLTRHATAGLLGIALVASPVWAVDKTSVAISMAQQAAKAYETGDYSRAAELYLNAWKTAADPNYLWGAARAEHLAGHDEQAEGLYGQFLVIRGADPERVRKGQGYLDGLEQKRVLAIAADADRALRDDPRLAANLYLDAFRLGPKRVDLLFKAALAEHEAGDVTKARAHLETYLAQAPADARERNQAEARLEAVRRKLEPAKAGTPGAGNPAVATGSAAGVPPNGPEAGAGPPVEAVLGSSAPSRVLGWTVAGSGAALALAGLSVYLATRGDIEQFNKDFPPSGKITDGSHADAVAREQDINTRVAVAAGLGGVGLAAAGVGGWLLLGGGPEAAVRVGPGPGGTGIELAWRF